MPYLDFSKKEFRFKIVYFGPPGAGKAANIRHIATVLPASRRTEPMCAVVHASQGIFMDISGPVIKGYRSVFTLMALTGYAGYLNDPEHETIVKRGDGFIFVADASKKDQRQNLRHLSKLRNLLLDAHYFCRYSEGKKGVPIVIQWNQTDSAPPAPFEDFFLQYRFSSELNGADVIHAIAAEGVGTYYSLQHCIDLIHIPDLGKISL